VSFFILSSAIEENNDEKVGDTIRNQDSIGWSLGDHRPPVNRGRGIRAKYMDKIERERTISRLAGHSESIPLRVLFLEDNPRDVELCVRALKKAGFEVQADTVDSQEGFAARLQSCVYDLILSDYRIPAWSGVEAFRLVKHSGKDIPFILVTGTLGEEAAVDLIKEGVDDYILKDRLVRLPLAVRRVLEEKSTRDEREQLERQLRQAQKMEAIGQLAGGVAHDFNNLLSVIIGYSEVLLERPGLDCRMRNQCEEIKKAGDRAASLTRQLLAFSRQQVLAPQVLNLNKVLIEIEKMLRRLIGENIELRIALDPAVGSVRADPGQIEQIIMNLAVNARDAMPDGGKLIIETNNAELDDFALHLTPSSAGQYVLLTVTDTGIGMDQETKNHIFELFFTTKDIGKGTGLGLSTVYGVVKQSNGHIWVYSEPGHGTVFKIYLPRIDDVDEPAERSLPCETALELFRGTETVLLVEDQESVRTMARTLLEGAGYTVLEASSGIQALEIAGRYCGRVHLLLTDVVMPGMNGRVLAQKMIAVQPLMKVLYVSGYAGSFSLDGELLGAGANLVQKPFSRTVLLRKLRGALSGVLANV
jgi:signal transduction histidine kinase